MDRERERNRDYSADDQYDERARRGAGRPRRRSATGPGRRGDYDPERARTREDDRSYSGGFTYGRRDYPINRFAQAEQSQSGWGSYPHDEDWSSDALRAERRRYGWPDDEDRPYGSPEDARGGRSDWYRVSEQGGPPRVDRRGWEASGGRGPIGRPAPGPHAGKGPRGYRGLDQRIQERVCQRLAENGDLDASDIEVEVEQGEVTLSGWVDGRWEKRLAEDLTDDVSGIRDIHNRLRVRDRRSRLELAAESGALATTASGARGFGRAGEGAGDALNATTITGSGMDTGLGMRHAPGMHSHTGTGTSGISGSGMGYPSMPGVGTPAAETRAEDLRATAGATPHMPSNTFGVRAGMEVTAADDRQVGVVSMVRSDDFVVDRRHGRDLTVPFDAIGSVLGDHVRLKVDADTLGRGDQAPAG